MKKFVPVLVALCAATAAHSAFAQAKPEADIKYRQAAFIVMARHFGSLGAMAEGKKPYDAKVAAADADVLAAVTALPFTAFGPGTDKGAKTEAKPEVWKDQAKFKQADDAMQVEMAKLIPAAKSGSLDQLKAAFGPTGKTCKGCHDDFKSK
ncbi:MAG: cytochrome c [Burkholderiaceae bacterium]|nr:cytochrome c [Burkholderiaceae bacterium]